MTTFKIAASVTVSCWTEVEADSPAEALKLAAKHDMAEHHIDGSFPIDECWHFDTDGTPDNLRIDEG